MIKSNPIITIKKRAMKRDSSKFISLPSARKAELSFQMLTELIMIAAVSMVLIFYGGAIVKDTEYYQLYFAKDMSLLLSSIASINSVDSVSVIYHPVEKSRFSEFSYLIDSFYTTVTYINNGGSFSYLFQKKGYDMDYIHMAFSNMPPTFSVSKSNPSVLYIMTDVTSVLTPLLVSDSGFISSGNSIFCDEDFSQSSNSAFLKTSFSSIVVDIDSLVTGMSTQEKSQIITMVSALKASNPAYSSVTLLMPDSLKNTIQTPTSTSSLIISFTQSITTKNAVNSVLSNPASSSKKVVTLRSSSKFSDYSCELMQNLDLKKNNAYVSYVPILSSSPGLLSQQTISTSPTIPISNQKAPYSIILSSDSMTTSINTCFEIINYIVSHSLIQQTSSHPSSRVSSTSSSNQEVSSAGIPVRKDSVRGTNP